MNLIPKPPSEEVGRRLAIIVLFVIGGLALWQCYLWWRQGRGRRRVEETEPDAQLPGRPAPSAAADSP
jgi:hypothetical protein